MTNLYYARWWTPVTRSLAALAAGVFFALVGLCARWLRGSGANTVELYAAAFVVTQTGMLAVMVPGLVAAKWLGLRLTKIHDFRRRALEERVVAFASGEPSGDCAAELRQWPREAAYVMDRALQLVSGIARDRLESLVAAAGMLPRLLADAERPNPNRAIPAVMLLGRLADPRAQAAVQRALAHSAGAVRVAACRAVLARGSADAQSKVLSELRHLPAWQRLVLFHLMPADSPVLLEFLQSGLRSTDDRVRLVALEFVLSRQRAFPAVCPADAARAASTEVRIKFFRALPFLQTGGSTVDILRAGLADSDWRVRAMAAKACGYFRTAALARELYRMCAADRNPVEAGHAARALASLGGHVWERLQPLMASSGEMVRRLAAEAVEKHMLAASGAAPRTT